MGAYFEEAGFRFNIRQDFEWARLESAMRRIVGSG